MSNIEKTEILKLLKKIKNRQDRRKKNVGKELIL